VTPIDTINQSRELSRTEPARKIDMHSGLARDPLDVVMLLFTVGRLVLIPLVVLSIPQDMLVSGLALGLFILADIYDGVLGRKRCADGPSRRALDSIVDRVAVHAVYIPLTFQGLLPVELLLVMLVRDTYCGYQCSRIMHGRWIAVRADGYYKALNLSLAGWVVFTPFVSESLRIVTFSCMMLYAGAVAVDLTHAVKRVLSMPLDVENVVIPAGSLRRMRRRTEHGTRVRPYAALGAVEISGSISS